MNKLIGQANGIETLVQATALTPELKEQLDRVASIVGVFCGQRAALADLVGADAATSFFDSESTLLKMGAGQFVTKPALEDVISRLNHIKAIVTLVSEQKPDFFSNSAEGAVRLTTITVQIQALPALVRQLTQIVKLMDQFAAQVGSIFWVNTDPFVASRLRRTGIAGVAAAAGTRTGRSSQWGGLSTEGFNRTHEAVDPAAFAYSVTILLPEIAVAVEFGTNDQSFLAGTPGQLAADICSLLTDDFDTKARSGEYTLALKNGSVEVTVRQQNTVIAKITFTTSPKSTFRFGQFDAQTRAQLVAGLKPIVEMYGATVRRDVLAGVTA